MSITVEHMNDTPDHRYDLPAEEVQRLTTELLQDREPVGDDRFVCYRLDGDDPYANIGRYIESTVFEGAFENSAEDMQNEYGPYEHQSTFYVSIDRDSQRATGALRVIRNGRVGLKTLNDLMESSKITSIESVQREYNIDDMDDCQDIGTVAVLPENRSAQGGISVQLYRAMYVDAMERGIKHFISNIDTKPLDKLVGYLGIPFEPLMNLESGPYLGSPDSQPVYGYVADFYKKMNRRRYTVKGMLARKALTRLVKGANDSELQFQSRYKKQ